jgi:tight adherence protein B
MRMAACWEVAEQSGSGLADGLSYVAESLQHEREVAAEIEGQLAGPRATVRLLITLPVLALIVGESLGAQPVAVLFTTTYGWLCLGAGSMLAGAGWHWVNRQVQTASPMSRL